MRQIELSAGKVENEDIGGDGPTLVLLHGLMMDASLWDSVIADLSVDHRRRAGPAARRQRRRPHQPDRPRLLRRVRHLPPGLTGKTLVLAGKLPPAMFGLFIQQMRLRPLRRLPIAFGWLTKRGDAATARWMHPVLQQREIRRDTVRVLRTAAAEKRLMLDAATCLPTYDRPASVVWASEDRIMPPGHGRRLAYLLPQGRLVEIADSYTLIPLDQPARLARIIREQT